ncbi:MAG: sensor histidine kinase [Galbitalea sp.]
MSSLAETKGSELRVGRARRLFRGRGRGTPRPPHPAQPARQRHRPRRGRPIVVYVDSDENAVALAVRDYGIGMTSAAMERVFDRFWRADPSRQRTTGGTGLGLAISLEDAALHGGLARGVERARRGLVLPAHAATAGRRTARVVAARPAAGRGGRSR